MSGCLWNSDAAETGVYVCQRCTQKPLRLPPSMRRPNVSRACKNPPPPGVGDHLRVLFGQLGFRAKEGCGCDAMAREMNELGPDGCEANLECFVRKLRKSYDTTTKAEAVRGSFTALTSGIAFQLDWTDPIPSLVRLAIERARKP